MKRYYVDYSTISDVLYNNSKLQQRFDCRTLAVAIRFLELNINAQEICAFEVRCNAGTDVLVFDNNKVFSDACILNYLIAKAIEEEEEEI